MTIKKPKLSLFKDNTPLEVIDLRRVKGGTGPETNVTGDCDSTMNGTDCGDNIRNTSFPYDSNPTKLGQDG